MQTLVGGEIFPSENGEIEMPPENAKNVKVVIENLLKGNFQEIKLGNANAKDILSAEQIKELQNNRNVRKTEKALQRSKEKEIAQR